MGKYSLHKYDGGYAVTTYESDDDESVFDIHGIEWFATKEMAEEYAKFMRIVESGKGCAEFFEDKYADMGILCYHLDDLDWAEEFDYPQDYENYIAILPKSSRVLFVTPEICEACTKEEMDPTGGGLRDYDLIAQMMGELETSLKQKQ